MRFLSSLIAFIKAIWAALTGKIQTTPTKTAEALRVRHYSVRETLKLLVNEQPGITRQKLYSVASGLQRGTFTPPRSRRHMKMMLRSINGLRCLQGGAVIAV